MPNLQSYYIMKITLYCERKDQIFVINETSTFIKGMLKYERYSDNKYVVALENDLMGYLRLWWTSNNSGIVNHGVDFSNACEANEFNNGLRF